MNHFDQFLRSNRLCRQTIIARLSVLILLVTGLDSQAQQAYVANQVIVKIKPGVQQSDVASMRASLNASVLNSLRIINAELWSISGITVADAIKRYQNDSRVEYIEPNYTVSAIRALPNDPNISQLWGLNNTGQTGGTADADIDAAEAWNIQTGGKVIIGVIDTGVDWKHEDLAPNIWVNSKEIPNNRIDDDGNGFIDDVRGWDFYNRDNDPMDDNGHGTHVSGTIAAVGNNGKGVAGVCWSAQIMPLKFLGGGGSGNTSDAVLALEYAMKMGAKLTSNSWGGVEFSKALYDAIAASGKAGMLFIAAAGNDGTNNDNSHHYPSDYDLDNIIAVAATTHTDAKASFSNFGLITVDLGAPGANIYSALPGNTYGSLSGTSMATPHVAGVAGLIWSQFPAMPHTLVKSRIMVSADPISALTGSTVSGGRLNAFKALAEPDTTSPKAVTDLATASPTSNAVTLTWTASGDDGASGKAAYYDVRYSTSPIDQRNFDSVAQAAGEPQPQATGSRETFTASGLAFKTTYYFALKVFDEWGNGSKVSNTISGTTLGAPDVATAPTALDQTLAIGKTGNQTLAIKNMGEGTLDFDLSIKYQFSGTLSVPAPEWAGMSRQARNGELPTPTETNKDADWIYQILQANEQIATGAISPIGEANGSQVYIAAPKVSADKIWSKRQQISSSAAKPIYAVVLDGLGTFSANTRLWDDLNANWSKYGTKELLIDYARFHTVEITYEGLVASGADALVISNNWDPTQPYGAFAETEAKAIARYVNEGAGLYISAGTFNNGEFPQLQSHVTYLAPLVGLSATEKYSWSGNTYGALEHTVPGHPIWQNVPTPYTSGWQTKTLAPSSRAWTTAAIPTGTLVGVSQNQQTAVVVYSNRVYYSSLAEISSGATTADKQFLYNTLALTGSRSSWLSVNPARGTVSAGNSMNIAVNFDANSLNVGDYRANVVIASNDPDENPVQMPITLKVTNDSLQPKQVNVTWCEYPITGNLTGARDTVFVCVDNVTGKNIISYQLTVTFDKNVLRAVGATSTGTISQAFGTPTANLSVDGQITVGGFGTQPLSGSGKLVGLIFDVVGKAGDATDLCFQKVSFNSGDPIAQLPAPCLPFKVNDKQPKQVLVTWCEALPNGFTGSKDTVYVCADEVTGKGLIAYQLAVTFDEKVLDAVGATTKGTISESFGTPTVNTTVDGRITVGGFGTQPLSGKGRLLGLIFNVVGEAGKTTNLCLQNVTLNSGDPAANIPTPCSPFEVKIINKLKVAGTLKYHITQSLLKSVTMTLSGGASNVQTTDPNGNYQFGELQSGLNYTVTPSKTEDIGTSAISCFDATLTAQQALNLITLTPQQKKAADVDNDGNISTFDAALICRFAVGLPPLNDNDQTGKWRFEPASRSYTPLNSNQTGQDYSASLLGDVDGSWKPANSANAMVALDGYGSLADLVASPGKLVSIPLNVDDRIDIQSAEIDFEYDSSVLRFVEVSKAGLSEGFQVVTNAEAGHVRVGAYGSEAVTEAGALLVLTFEVIGPEGARSPLNLKRFQVNGELVKHAKAELVVGAPVAEIPKQFALGQNYPNPFNPETTIRFDIPNLKSEPVNVQLAIYKISGQLVRLLVNDERAPGSYQIQWDGRNEVGERVSSGVYFYTITAGDFKATKKMLVLK